MRIWLVLEDWRNERNESVYDAEECRDLTFSTFHAGTTFRAEIELDEHQEAEIRDAMVLGLVPKFGAVLLDDDVETSDPTNSTKSSSWPHKYCRLI